MTEQEPTVQVPVALIEALYAEPAISAYNKAVLRALLSQPTPTAEPVNLPTREQIAAAMYLVVRPIARFDKLGPGGQSLYLDMADAALALFQNAADTDFREPTPTTEQIEREAMNVQFENMYPDDAAPPRIEDMAPGTTFEYDGVRWEVQEEPDGSRYAVDGDDRILHEAIDPSTIRDVTPPKGAS